MSAERVATIESKSSDAPGAISWLRGYWPLLLIIGAYALSAFLVPTLAPVAVSDDPLHARSVEILVQEGKLEVLPLVVVTLIGQVLWTAPFAWLFGDSFGVMRVATVTIVGLSAIPMFGLLREIGISRRRSALGTTLYLFNPLTYALAFTFMSDGYLVAGVVTTAYCFVRGIRRSGPDSGWLVVASAVAGVTFLVRHQAALLLPSMLAYLLARGDLPMTRVGLRRAIRISAPFLVLAAAYYLWYHVIQGTPTSSAQVDVSSQWLSADPIEGFVLFRRITFMEMMYGALFLLPILFAVLPSTRRLVHMTRRPGWWAIGLWGVVVLLGLTWYGHGTARMPYLSQFVSPSGLGPPGDVRGGRDPLLSPSGQAWLTGICAVAAMILALVLFHQLGRRVTRRGDGIGLVVSLLIGQAFGVIISSYPLRDTAISRDRYLLPLLPLLIVLVLWCLRNVRLVEPVAWVGAGAFALISVVGVHDFLSFQETVWASAKDAHEAGVPYRELDGGAAWDAYHLYEYSYENDVQLELPKGLGKLKKPLLLSDNDVTPWWIGFYAPATNAEYVVSSEPLIGYREVDRRTWYSWFRQRHETVYLLRNISND